MKEKLLCAGLIASAFLSGCANHGVGPDTWGNEIELTPSASNPSPTSASAKKVVIFDVDEGDLNAASEAGLATPIYSALDDKLTGAGAELVDRDLAAKLKEEIQRAEMGGSGAYQGAPIADFAVRTRITRAAFGSEFKEAYRYETDDGEIKVQPPQCNYSSEVRVTVDVYKVPELTRLNTFKGEGDQWSSEETRNSNCAANGSGMLREAASEAIVDMQEELQNYFAPVGYVVNALEYNLDEDSVLIKTSLTPQLGAKEGATVKFFNVTTGGDRYKIGEGEIGTPVVRSGAIVVVDKELAAQIKRGDEVKMDYECSLLGCQLDGSLGEAASSLM